MEHLEWNRYHGDHNIPAMLKFVEPLHKELEKGASTAKEDSFQVPVFSLLTVCQ